MELTKDALRDVSFRARGKWYRGEDVDGFLAELMVALDEAEQGKTGAGRRRPAPGTGSCTRRRKKQNISSST